MPPHVFPERVQVSLDKIREVIILDFRSPRCRSHKNPASEAGDPARRRRTGIRIVRPGHGRGRGRQQQEVVQTIRAAIGATMPVRRVPETVQEALGKRLVEDDEGRLFG
jgi:hypothetical protein